MISDDLRYFIHENVKSLKTNTQVEEFEKILTNQRITDLLSFSKVSTIDLVKFVDLAGGNKLDIEKAVVIMSKADVFSQKIANAVKHLFDQQEVQGKGKEEEREELNRDIVELIVNEFPCVDTKAKQKQFVLELEKINVDSVEGLSGLRVSRLIKCLQKSGIKMDWSTAINLLPIWNLKIESRNINKIFKILRTISKECCIEKQELQQKLNGELKEANILLIDSPRETRVTEDLHANYLNQDKSFIAFTYSTKAVQKRALKAMYDQKVERHCNLANNFTVMAKHPKRVKRGSEGCGAMFPESSDTFKDFPINKWSVVGKDNDGVGIFIKVDEDKDNKSLITLRYKGEEIHPSIPINRLDLGDGLTVQREATKDPSVFKLIYSENGSPSHSMLVRNVDWEDFGAVNVDELNKNAKWLLEADMCSSNCRAGVGRTGTLFVATEMLKWKGNHPGENLTKTQVVQFILTGRKNRDAQVVQSKRQLELLMNYMVKLNQSQKNMMEVVPSLSDMVGANLKALKLPNGNHIISGNVKDYLKDDKFRLFLANHLDGMTVENEVKLENLYENLVCPISYEMLKDPVVTPGGISYERNEIEAWLVDHSTCPVTCVKLLKNELISDSYTVNLMKILDLSTKLKAPKTRLGIDAQKKISELSVNEPIQWCRILSAVMPKNTFFVRHKGPADANHFVIELRGDSIVHKQSFSLNDEGRLVASLNDEVSYGSIEEFVEANGTNLYTGVNPLKHLSKEDLAEFNSSMGRDIFMKSLTGNKVKNEIIKHLRMNFNDSKKVKKGALGYIDQRFKDRGYVRVGRSPSSLPCFTVQCLDTDEHGNIVKRKNQKGSYIRFRVCVSEGELCMVKSIAIPAVADSDKEVKKYIDHLKFRDTQKRILCTKEDKKAFYSEYLAIKSQLPKEKSMFHLFIPTNVSIENRIKLASVEAKEVDNSTMFSYTT